MRIEEEIHHTGIRNPKSAIHFLGLALPPNNQKGFFGFAGGGG
jgi:hypothetical protein